jgi:hypothetical protein
VGKSATALSSTELAHRLDRLLAIAETVIADVPDPYICRTAPREEWTVRELGYRIFRFSLAFADGMDLGRVSPDWLAERAPDGLTDGPSIARYGALVRGRLAGWFEGAGPGEYARTIDVCGAGQSGRELLERTARDAAHHLRQLHALLTGIGIPPREPLPTADFEGLALTATLC